jgi:hypothetical protein
VIDENHRYPVLKTPAACRAAEKVRRSSIPVATDAPNSEVRERWLDLAESWLAMVPRDLRELEKVFERAVQGQGLQRDALKTRH